MTFVVVENNDIERTIQKNNRHSLRKNEVVNGNPREGRHGAVFEKGTADRFLLRSTIQCSLESETMQRTELSWREQEENAFVRPRFKAKNEWC